MITEQLQMLMDNSSCFDDKLVVECNLAEIMKIIKETYHFDTLKNITASRNDNSVEIIYNLYTTEDEEDLKVLIHVKKSAESIIHIYPSAKEFQEKISKDFSIKFF